MAFLRALTWCIFFLFAGIGVLVSAWSRHSNAALIGCIGVRFLLCVLAPRAAVRMIDEHNRLPSRFELNRHITQGYSKGMGQDGTSTERNREAPGFHASGCMVWIPRNNCPLISTAWPCSTGKTITRRSMNTTPAKLSASFSSSRKAWGR